jgi:RNA polymerase sigma-70 factor (ECF subfamily)
MYEAALMTGLSRKMELTFVEIVRLREAQLLRTAYRILGNWAGAEDVVQEAFVRLHRHGLRFPADAALAAWLYRVTVNLCLDRARAARPSGELKDLDSGHPSAEWLSIREQQKHRLMAALGTLPARERAAVVLREIEGLSTAEVARILGSAEGTVRSQVSKALAHLREILGKEER